jgi:glycogen operon protein
VRLNDPDWGSESHSLALELHDPLQAEHLHILLNAYWEALEFELPLLPASQRWRRVIDTSLPAPDDFAEPPAALPKSARRYLAQPLDGGFESRESLIADWLVLIFRSRVGCQKSN